MSATPSTLEPEWSTLLAACAFGIADRNPSQLKLRLQVPVRWELLFALAERHGVQSLLFHALQPLASSVPAHEMQSLAQVYNTNLHKALLLSSELIRITQYLAELGIETLTYKGLALAENLYGDIALRQAGDIDLLVRSADLARVSEALATIGYAAHCSFSNIEEEAYRKSGYEYAYDGPLGRNVLEVQWAFQPHFYAVDFDMNAIFTRALGITVAGQKMKTPSFADQMLTLSVHAAKHVWGRLIWLCDIARLMNLPDMDWNWILSQAKELGIRRIVAVSLLLANRVLGAEVPTVVRTTVASDHAAARVTDDIQTYIAGENAFDVESLSYFRLMMKLRERASDRFRFVSRLALTPGPSEWRAVHLPSPLFPLYRLIRISRLAGKMVKA